MRRTILVVAIALLPTVCGRSDEGQDGAKWQHNKALPDQLRPGFVFLAELASGRSTLMSLLPQQRL
jgi:hypothetical protein